MTPAARIATTIDALEEIAAARGPADVVLGKFFRSRRYVGSKDRAAVAESVYRILRHTARLTWWVERVGLPDTPRSHVLADQMLNAEVPLAELHLLCDGGDYAPHALSQAEHQALKQLSNSQINHADMPEWVALECPEDLLSALRDAYGDDVVPILRAMQQPAALDVRVNSLKDAGQGAGKLLQQFKQVQFDVERGRYAPLCLRIHGRPNLNSHPAFSTGLVEVQDEGSQILAALVDARAGMRVFDFCAGAGGKTLALAAAMQNKGRILATDISESRLQKAKLRFRRANVQNVETHALENENDSWLKRHKDSCDRVLVDAPCSGTGTWRRNPEMRWKEPPTPKGFGAPRGGVGMDELLQIQQSILASAARLVKAGGRLVYATCSLLPQENEMQVEKFLAENPQFSVVPVGALWGAAGLNGDCPVAGDYLRLNPYHHATDGFFAAVLERKAG